MLKRLPINDVQVGMVIIQITQQFGPVKIKKSGLVTSSDMVKGLAEMGVGEVEVDLDQTVELENDISTTIRQTQTQALLQGKYDRKGHQDQQSSDQYNRNLFLPSVQGIPSLWSLYFRQIIIASFSIVIGFGVGYFLSSPKDILLGLMNNSQSVNTSAKLEQISIKEKTVAMPEVASEIETDSTNLNNVDANNADANNTQVSKNVIDINATDDATSVASKNTKKEAATGNETVAAMVANANIETVKSEAEGVDNVSGLDNSRYEYQGEVGVEITGTNQQDDAVSVSPELLKRFNKAVEQLDSKPTADIGDITPSPALEAEDDIQRIDQLPVRVMTTLPSMTFTAHIYASKEAERWVRVNGKRLQEGDFIADKVQIIAIEPQRIVLGYQGEIFSMVALTDW